MAETDPLPPSAAAATVTAAATATATATMLHRRLIYGPENFEDNFRILKKQNEIRPVLAKFERIYDEIQLDNGLGFGFFDPATNILVNSIISNSESAPPPPPLPPYAGRRRRREEEDDDNRAGAARAYMAQRSLDGLIAFLTCLFPHLPDAEALAYLDAADLDPLVAALVIINRRMSTGWMMPDDLDPFTRPFTEAAAEVALRCAAAAAKHPDPRWLVKAWKKLLILPAAETLCRGSSPPSRETLRDAVLHALDVTVAPDALELKRPWYLAKERAEASYESPTKELPPVRAAMKRRLLATIHGLYVQALGRLPTAELCSQYHRSLLLGGYCYGPLDPLSNIIINAIWYERNLPTGIKQFPVSMVSTQMLWRIAARSLYGLISFLCTRHHGLTPDQAVEHLLMTGGDLQKADSKLSWWRKPVDFLDSGKSTRVEAYKAAAAAAFHPFPDAHSEFLDAYSAHGFGSVSEVLHARDGSSPLTCQDIISLLSNIIQNSSPISNSHQQHDLAPTKVNNLVYHNMMECIDSFWGKHDRVTAMVRNALDKFNKTATVEGHLFELHIIFGCNEFVSGPVHSDETVGAYNPWTSDKYYHTHINFLAVCKDHPLDPPTIFFAECGKDGADTCWCVPVSLNGDGCYMGEELLERKGKNLGSRIGYKGEQPRCVYCEYQANRILHPTVESFYGRDEFDILFYGSDRKVYSNNRIIQNSKLDINWVHGVEDAAIYFNYYPDGNDGDEADWIRIS